MLRFRELIRALLAFVLIASGVPALSAAQTVMPLEVGTRTWVGHDVSAPAIQITIDAKLAIFATSDDAHVHHQQSLVSIATLPFGSEVVSTTSHDVDPYFETVLTFTYQTEAGSSGVGQQIIAQLGPDAVRAVLTIESLDGTLVSAADLDAYRSGLGQVIVNVFTTDSSPGEPVDSGVGWTGGMMDRLPPLQLHPADSTQLTFAMDSYLVGDSTTLLPEESGVAGPAEPTVETATLLTEEPGTEESEEPDADTEESADASEESEASETQGHIRGNGWIALASPDSLDPGIRFVRPDASETIPIWTGLTSALAWSHDGTMFAFAGPTHPMFGSERGIFVLVGGEVLRLPDTDGCTYPAFTADNQRVMYVCIPPEAEDEMGAAMAENSDRILTIGTAELGTIRSSRVDGTHSQVEYELTDSDLVDMWDDPAGPIIVAEILVSPVDGSALVTYIHQDESPIIPRAVVFDSEFEVVHTATYDQSSIFPTMLPDGTIVTGTHCNGQLCANGLPYDLETLDGTQVTDPLLTDLIVYETWSTTLAPDGTSSLNSDRNTGVWLYHGDGAVTVLYPMVSANQPKWQPTTVEIVLPATPRTPYDDYAGMTSAWKRD